MHSVTDRRTDGQQAYANSRSYCVAVRSAKNQMSRLYLRYNITSACFYSTKMLGLHIDRSEVVTKACRRSQKPAAAFPKHPFSANK